MSRLIVEDLHFAREGRSILSGISFDHATGVLTLLGPSGSGKTTLLWLLAGLLTPDRGRVEVDSNHQLGFVFQDGGLWEHVTVRDHLELVLRGRGLPRDDRHARATRVLDETGLSSLAKRRPGELSGGERQRLSLARALVIEPRWLFLDEPTSQLDGPARQELIELLETRLRATRAGVILATHQVDLAMRLSDRIAVLLEGRIAQVGSPAEAYDRPANLAVARLLGPAFEMRVGDEMRIVRPHQARFETDAGGPFTVTGCHFAGGCWHVAASDGATSAVVASDVAVVIGTRGRVHIGG